MVEYCDFEVQKSAKNEDDRFRPDMIIRLPGGRNVVVDAKVPLVEDTDAWETTPEDERRAKRQNLSSRIRKHMADLNSKEYWKQFDPTPEFVVMFLPGESLFSTALEQDPKLIEEGFRQKVLLATPITLIAILRSVGYSWRQEKIAENAKKINELGNELYNRITTLVADHFIKVGSGLRTALNAYNDAVGSLEGSVLPSARRFSELGAAGSEEIPILKEIDTPVRKLQKPELLEKQAPDLREKKEE